MSDNNKKKTGGKTINFAERKKAINNKQSEQNPQKGIINDNRVIQYDINKMREQINQQTKNKKSKFQNFSGLHPLWVKAIYLIILILFIILVASKLTNNFGIVNKNSIPDKFIYQTSKLTDNETTKYEALIDTSIKKYVNSNGELDVVTTSIHKNDKYIYANGYFIYPDDSDRIYFDAKIESEKISSIVVNGYELLK